MQVADKFVSKVKELYDVAADCKVYCRAKQICYNLLEFDEEVKAALMPAACCLQMLVPT